MAAPTPPINNGQLGLRATDINAPTLGMRGTHTWTDSELPRGYRAGLLYLRPNGKAPLTAMISKLRKVKESQSHFHWFSKKLQYKGCDVDVTGDSLAAVDVNGAVRSTTHIAIDDTISITVEKAFGYQVRVGHMVMLRKADQQAYDVVIKVTGVSRGSSALVVGRAISGCATDDVLYDRMIIIGNYNPEASVRPAAVSYNASEFGGMQQIWRNPLAMSRTDLNNKSRLGDRYKQLKRETMEDHAMEQELSLLFGEMSWELGDNGMAERTMQGIIPFVRANASENVVDVGRDVATSMSVANGTAWTTWGLEALEEYLIRPSFKWGDAQEKFVFCGSGVLSAIQQVVRGSSQYQITNGAAAYGIKVTSLETVHGTWHFHKHPLFNHESSMQNSLLAFEPDKLEWRYSLDMHYEKDIHFGKGGGDGVDGIQEGFITEGGLAIYHPELITYASNIGTAAITS